MPLLRLTTGRLYLIAGNLDISEAELSDRGQFASLLGATIMAWPPPLNDEDSIRWTRDFFQLHPNAAGWSVWYFMLRGDDGARLLIGNGGFKGLPGDDGTVEIGYSILESHHRRGYASEAVRALLAWAFGHHEVTRVIAETLPELTPSIGVLEKTGFRYIGEGSEPGVIRYELTRAIYAPA